MRRTIIELMHILLGVAGTLAIATLCAWAVPQVGEIIWLVSLGVVAIVVFMGVRPLRLAWRADHAAAAPRD